MTKLEYLKLLMNSQAYGHKNTLISVLSILIKDDEESTEIFKQSPLAVFLDGNTFKFIHEGEEVSITDVKYKELPLFDKDEIIKVGPDFHPFIKEEMETTFCILLFNIVLFWDVFGDESTYVNGEITPRYIQNLISSKLVDEIKPTDEQAKDPEWKPVYPKGKFPYTIAVERFNHHMNYLLGLDAYIIRSSCIEALSPSEAVLALRKELFEKHKDEINDPVVFTNIVDQLVKLDLEEQSKAYNSTFYTKGKFIADNRKRMFTAFGIEKDPEGGMAVMLTNSLDEGWETGKFNNYVNSTVSGSYARGKATGEGGAKVKTTIQLIGGSKGVKGNCGTTVTESVLIEEHNKGLWVGSYRNLSQGSGEVELITKENVDKLLGKIALIRVPSFCVQPNGDWCSTCLGEALGLNIHQVAANVTKIPTKFMLGKMKLTHVASDSNTKLDLAKACK